MILTRRLKRWDRGGESPSDHDDIEDIPAVRAERLEAQAVEADENIDGVEYCKKEEYAVYIQLISLASPSDSLPAWNSVKMLLEKSSALESADDTQFVSDLHEEHNMQVINDGEASLPVAVLLCRSLVTPSSETRFWSIAR